MRDDAIYRVIDGSGQWEGSFTRREAERRLRDLLPIASDARIQVRCWEPDGDSYALAWEDFRPR